MRRSYAGGAVGTTSTNAIDEIALAVNATALVGWPSGADGPFTMTIDDGEPTEETVLCESYSGLTLTILQRGYAGTTAQAHSAGATLKHTGSAVDFDEANDHVNGATGHGVTGPGNLLVGTKSIQALINKTIDGALNTIVNVAADAVVGLVEHLNASEAHGTSSAVVGTTDVQTLTNKTIDGASNTLSNIAQSAVSGLVASLNAIGLHIATSTGVHGTSGSVVGTSGAQTLSNKTLASPSFSGTSPTGLDLAGALTAGTQVVAPDIASSGSIVAGQDVYAATFVSSGLDGRIRMGTTVGITSGAGDLTVPTGLASVSAFVGCNGDGTANGGVGLTVQVQRPIVGGDVVVRVRRIDTGAVMASNNVRIDWVANT